LSDGTEGKPANDRPGSGVDRRAFLRGGVILGGAAAVDAAFAHARAITGPTGLTGPQSSLIGELQSLLSDSKPTLSLALRRREDFLFLRLDGYNLKRQGQKLVRKLAGHDAYLVVTFEPQHIAEQAYLEPTGHPKPPGRSKALMAYPSRLAFKLPTGVSIPLTVDGLLDWAALTPSLTDTAAYSPFVFRRAIARPGPGGSTPVKVIHAGPPPKIQKPTGVQTAIELPWRLVISPTSGGQWSHPKHVITAAGWTELWHTRLADGSVEPAPDGGPFRAVWNYDVKGNGKPTLSSSNPPAASNSPFRTSLDPHDRWEIVTATSNFKVPGRADAQASKLWLSTRGGFLDSNGEWDSTAFGLAQWKHLATLGRDQYVKVVYKGFLFPFGHRAVYVKVTERMFEKVGSEIVATSRQIQYVVIREPAKSYDPANTFGISHNSRDLPFRSLTITTLRTPPVTTPAFVTGFSENPFVPTLAGKPFLWHFIGTDWIGQQSEFTAPAVFVFQEDGWDAGHAAKVRDKYNGLPATGSIRVGQFTGQEVAFATSHNAGDTNLSVQAITFGAGGGTGGTLKQFKANDQPITYPNVAQAEVTLSAAAQAAGGAPLGTNPVVSYHPDFVVHDFNSTANKGNLFLEIQAASQPALNFAAGSSGGVITPNLQLSGLSRSLGPVAGDVSNILGGTFDPASVFGSSLNATILGGVKLIDLIKLVTGISGDSPTTQAMQIISNTVGASDSGLDRRAFERGHVPTPPVPTKRTTNFHWEPDIVGNNPIVSKDPSATYSFTLDGVVTTDLLHPQNSTFSLTGELKGFVVSLMSNQDSSIEFITITFKELTFKAGSGQKSSVNVDISNIAFDGPLKFIEELEKFMDFSGDGGPKITIEPDGISADLAVALPPISVGIFSLSNIGIDAGFNLPFDGSPARFRFSFSTQDNPFTLSVAIFGGGGFFGIAIGTDGVELIQASFEFGAMAAIDLGVASGSVELVAGIYFSYGELPGSTKTTCVLTGFVKLDGHLSILGIITLSLEFDLSLTYMEPPSSVTGTATLTVSVSVLFFSFSVSVTASKTFGGGSSDSSAGQLRRNGRARAHITGSDTPPNFASQMPDQTTWSTYCGAFASN
jgi:hypothetical protein